MARGPSQMGIAASQKPLVPGSDGPRVGAISSGRRVSGAGKTEKLCSPDQPHAGRVWIGLATQALCPEELAATNDSLRE
jgi:hypothetical protein